VKVCIKGNKGLQQADFDKVSKTKIIDFFNKFLSEGNEII
jgi:hypothetical protein